MNILKFRRKTLESDIEIKLNYFGIGLYKVKTFCFFFDHIFIQFINYSLLDCYLRCYSDLKIDSHHLIEDIGIILGKTIFKIKKNRYNSYFICMDDSISIMIIDYCNRSYYDDNFLYLDNDIQIIKEFFISYSRNCKCSIHIYCYNYNNKHHLIESIFKLFGILFNNSKFIFQNNSTKGIL